MTSAEEARLAALGEYAVAGTAPEREYDRIVRLAADLFGVPIALVSLVERDRQWLKARVGLEVEATPREVSFCAHTIRSDAALVVPDAAEDPRFAGNPLVTGAPGIRFYAGAPLVTREGHRLGALCLIDTAPRRPLDEREERILRDLAALVVDHLEVRRLHRRGVAWQRVAEAMSDALVVTDERLRVTGWNEAAAVLFGYAAPEARGLSFHRLLSLDAGDVDAARGVPLGSVPPRGGDRPLRVLGHRRDGSTFPAEVSLSLLPEDETSGFAATVRDLSGRRRQEARLHAMAYTDALTGLANRAHLRRALEAALEGGGRATLVLIDVDGFKGVNDRLGHSAGDALLVGIGRRLSARTGEGVPGGTAPGEGAPGEGAPGEVLVARLGGDEFAVLVAGHADPLAADALARALRADLERPFDLPGGPASITGSVGVALAPMHGEEADALVGSADLALYRAKALSRNAVVLFAPHLRSEAAARHRLGADLHAALERGEFVLHYQPQVRLADGAIVGAEALLRWQHPERGLIMPGDFLPVLETHALIPRLGAWVLRTACAQAALWQRARPALRIAVNLFGAQLRAETLVDEVAAALAASGLPAACLDLELTENIALQENDAYLARVQALRDLGVQVALDDFGTGYASLGLLKRLRLDRLKIDRGFVRDLCEDPRDAAVVGAVVALAQSFGLAVLAEGVETPEQRRRLLAMGCAEAQGYLFGRPMPEAAFAARLAGRRLAPKRRPAASR